MNVEKTESSCPGELPIDFDGLLRVYFDGVSYSLEYKCSQSTDKLTG